MHKGCFARYFCVAQDYSHNVTAKIAVSAHRRGQSIGKNSYGSNKDSVKACGVKSHTFYEIHCAQRYKRTEAHAEEHLCKQAHNKTSCRRSAFHY